MVRKGMQRALASVHRFGSSVAFFLNSFDVILSAEPSDYVGIIFAILLTRTNPPDPPE